MKNHCISMNIFLFYFLMASFWLSGGFAFLNYLGKFLCVTWDRKVWAFPLLPQSFSPNLKHRILFEFFYHTHFLLLKLKTVRDELVYYELFCNKHAK